MPTNEEINTENDRLRRQAEQDAADRRVIPNSGHYPRSIPHHIYIGAYKGSGGQN